MTMKYSTFMMPLHPPGRNVTETLQEDREAIILADRLGFSEAYVGEHVTDAAEIVTSSMIFLATLAAETKQIKLGTGTLNLPNSHPAAIAAQAAMLDHLLKGRFIMGISPGTAKEYIRRVRVKYAEHGEPLPSKVELYKKAQEEGLL